MKAEFILKVTLPPIIIFTIIIWLTVENVITGWTMYLTWIVGFIVANFIVTRITAKWSIERQKAKRCKEEKKDANE